MGARSGRRGRSGRAGRGGVGAACGRDVTDAPAHVPLPEGAHRRLPVRADAGRVAGAGGRTRPLRAPAAPLGAVRAHAQLPGAHRRADRPRRLPLRQEAAVPLLRLPRPGRVRAQHPAGRARRLRRGRLRARGRALAPRAARRRPRRPGRPAAQRHRPPAARGRAPRPARASVTVVI